MWLDPKVCSEAGHQTDSNESNEKILLTASRSIVIIGSSLSL